MPTNLDPQEDYNVEFDPPDLKHTVRFPTNYLELPNGSPFFVCDLINIEQPEMAVDPKEVTVVFTESKHFICILCVAILVFIVFTFRSCCTVE